MNRMLIREGYLSVRLGSVMQSSFVTPKHLNVNFEPPPMHASLIQLIISFNVDERYRAENIISEVING